MDARLVDEDNDDDDDDDDGNKDAPVHLIVNKAEVGLTRSPHALPLSFCAWLFPCLLWSFSLSLSRAPPPAKLSSFWLHSNRNLPPQSPRNRGNRDGEHNPEPASEEDSSYL